MWMGQARPPLTRLILSNDALQREELQRCLCKQPINLRFGSSPSVVNVFQRFNQPLLGNGFPKQFHDDV